MTRRALEVFPDVNFSDPRVKWADFTGDGLQDIALVYDGNIEYWPNLGRGEWGKRIHMQKSPRFPYGYDPRRILIGDVDGDGLADIVYVEDTKVTLWINQSGNSWSDPITILGTPPVSDMDSVRLVDVLGSGISGVLWSRDANALSRDHFFFLDFTGGLKPYLLHEMDNHIGVVTKVEYAPSTTLLPGGSKAPETRWKTTLPFPVHVVSRVEVIDHFSKGKLTTEYHYHHGYWDGAEREFRGFGMVEQRDTESFEEYDSGGLTRRGGLLRKSRSAILFPAHSEQDLVSSRAGGRRIRRLAGTGLVRSILVGRPATPQTYGNRQSILAELVPGTNRSICMAVYSRWSQG